MSTVHKSVLLKESIMGLNLTDDSLVIDATFGAGGHSKEILDKYQNTKIIALDQDKNAWNKAKDKFKGLEKRILFKNLNFRDLDDVLEGIDKSTKFDAIIFDLGLSSDQLENSGRGFSFMKDEPLLMTMKISPSEEDLTASYIVNHWEEKNIADIIYGYGEEKFARRIAKGIVEAREKKEIKNTAELTEIIKNSIPKRFSKGKIHFATKTFQALRIAVNDELNALKDGLEKAFNLLKTRGRMSVISFHSLEDRIVKQFYKNKVKEDKAILINKKPITASEEEKNINNRSRSAKLRILEKI